jgi:hypothetical protein
VVVVAVRILIRSRRISSVCCAHLVRSWVLVLVLGMGGRERSGLACTVVVVVRGSSCMFGRRSRVASHGHAARRDCAAHRRSSTSIGRVVTRRTSASVVMVHAAGMASSPSLLHWHRLLAVHHHRLLVMSVRTVPRIAATAVRHGIGRRRMTLVRRMIANGLLVLLLVLLRVRMPVHHRHAVVVLRRGRAFVRRPRLLQRRLHRGIVKLAVHPAGRGSTATARGRSRMVVALHRQLLSKGSDPPRRAKHPTANVVIAVDA